MNKKKKKCQKTGNLKKMKKKLQSQKHKQHQKLKNLTLQLKKLMSFNNKFRKEKNKVPKQNLILMQKK